MEEYKREAGVLLPISALPSPYGIGAFSKEAYRFVDMLASAGQSAWQILPLCPTSIGDSPYQSPCSFAGNPYFLSLDALVAEGLLELSELPSDDRCARVDYGALYSERYPLLRRAYERFSSRQTPEGYSEFEAENASWLEDYALFMAIKNSLDGAPLSDFPTPLLHREPSALSETRQALSECIGFYKFLQYEFFKQWRELRSYANGKGVRIIGDIPIYVSSDSVEVWTRPELFMLDDKRQPRFVAGCPPDDFSPTGQLWGNPVYEWEAHRAEGFRWWSQRLSHALSLYDTVRLDHFRGFEAFYCVPLGAPDATGGSWRDALGEELFATLSGQFSKNDIIAEDLGFITDGVRHLLDSCGFAGMKVMQSGFDSAEYDSVHLPHSYPPNSVVYTGTHDNPTLREWLELLDEPSRQRICRYFCAEGCDGRALGRQMICGALRSCARLCIIPFQDYLWIGAEGRMNTPSRPYGNWAWRMRSVDLTPQTFSLIRELCEPYGRIS